MNSYNSIKKSKDNIAKYELLGRVPEGKHIVAYVVKSRITGKTEVVDKQTLEELVINKDVYDVTCQIYNGKVNLRSQNFKLTELPLYDIMGNRIERKVKKGDVIPFLTITGKIIDNKRIIGYVVENTKLPEKERERVKLSKEKVIEVIKLGYITNAKTQLCNGETIIRGYGSDLSNLPAYVKIGE